MVKYEPTDDGRSSSPFSPGLTRDIDAALRAYLLAYHPESDAILRSLTNRVCAEAKVLGLPSEKMLIAIKRLFDDLSLPDAPHSERRQQVFEKFISGCIESYFSVNE